MTYFSYAKLKNSREAMAFTRNQMIKNQSLDNGHKLVWTLFSNDPNARRDFLFRKTRDDHFLIVSEKEPIFDEAIWEIKTKSYNPSFEACQKFGFSILINPTSAKKLEEGKHSKRIDVLMDAKQNRKEEKKLNPDIEDLNSEEREIIAINWLSEKLLRNGAQIEKENCQLMQYSQMRIPRESVKETDGKKEVVRSTASISYIDVEGVLEVKDPETLQKALIEGIGAGKAFGLGLLLLRPLG